MQTIGERLEEARKRKGISIREAAEATKIRSDYLHKFESNQFDINLSEIYVRGFLRVYAQLLKLPADKILNDYAALGRGEPRSKQASREVYGRMDISVASAEKTTPEPAPAAAQTEQPAQDNPSRRGPALHRSGSSLPKGPAIDPALLFKSGLILGGVIILGLIIWGVSSLFTGSKPDPVTQVSSPAQRNISLVALRTVSVTVVNKNPDGSEGSQIFQGTLTAGQRQVVAWPGPIFIKANAGENLEIEYAGRRYPTGFTGNAKAEM